ncbi:bacillithiol biosynthesis deacetylase BshB2 [Bacillaceae bacterium]
MERHVLVVFPHPDDESFGVSGTIAMYASRGTPVTYVCLTLGEMGRNLGNPPFANRETLPAIRRRELEEACRILGIRDLRLFGLRDKTVEFEDPEELADRIAAVIEEVNPSLIITFYPGFSVHPDHEACGRAVVLAVERLPADKRPVVHAVAFAKNCEKALGKPDIVNDIRAFKEQKIAAMKAHRSQTSWMMDGIEKGLAAGDPATVKRFLFERFWTYRF